MKYAVAMGSGGMTYIPNLINIGSGIQKLIGRIHGQIDTRDGDRRCLALLTRRQPRMSGNVGLA
jgi:hypothetical protein